MPRLRGSIEYMKGPMQGLGGTILCLRKRGSIPVMTGPAAVLTSYACEGPYPGILMRVMSVNINHGRASGSTEGTVAMTRRARTISEGAHTTHVRACSSTGGEACKNWEGPYHA